ncbi:aminopeptidase N [Kocuria palustris]|uniref:aminopeptidase N n=1 Tax=Kocuria palustris TaxID=71999 RepID=UPI00077B7373|nr:aminopeptidase N [Kocuria palustris]
MPTPSLTREEAADRTQRVRPHRCEVDLDLTGAPDPAHNTYPVEVIWSFSFDRGDGPDETFLDFTGQVSEAEINGRSLSTEQIAAAFCQDRLRLQGLQAENRVRVRGEALYSRSGEGMHRYTDPQDGKVYLYTQYEPADAHRVMPCFDQPDLRAEWIFRITAPRQWEVRSNSTALRAPAEPGGDSPEQAAATHHEFAPTLPIPAYLTSVLAGPYVSAESSWESSSAQRPQSLPLHLWCRASMAEHLDAEEIFTITRQGLDFFTELFDLPYPFETYEQAFVPEYNLGAMENPGLVTFTEDYLFPDGASREQLAGRANTILHEMAHMWFGDLVAIRWWEDLWLKESFAEFMGAHASVSATQFTEAWAGFAVRRKAWAYRQDAMATTHPIVADVPDVAAAKQNFDGITYAKGAAALKQLVAFVGLEDFTRACRVYFRRHAFGSARLEDFLAVLQESSQRDTASWARDWLTTTGATVLRLQTRRDPDGTLVSASLTPEGTVHDPASERDHQLAVSVWGTDAQPQRSLELTLSGRTAHELPELAGADGVVVVNDRDLDYAEIVADEPTRADQLARLSSIPDPMARAVVWSALWTDVRQARLDPEDFTAAVIDHLFAETDEAVFTTVLGQAEEALESYLPARRRPQIRGRLLRRVIEELHGAEHGSDRQRSLASSFARLGQRDGAAHGLAQDLLSGEVVLPGLHLGPALRWSLLTGLVATNHAVDSSILRETERDASRVSQIGRARTNAARPTSRAKDLAWAEILGHELTNDLLTATIEGFQLGSPDLLAPYRKRYFEIIDSEWSQRSIGMATRLVRGLFPAAADLAPGADPEQDPILRRSQQWLQEHPQADPALRRVVIECRDELARRLRAQAAARP